ncbi:MAG TPA: tetratricopeptide repeat protein, partial [Burkholderiales bacterium]|nr:tetratricopeptide repeat protein [Burkholderiales bacterium]
KAAIELAEESLVLKRTSLGSDHPEVARSLNTIAMWSMEAGDYATAEPMLRESYDINTKALGDEHPDVASSMTLLASCVVANGDFDEGYQLAAKAKSIFAASLPEGHWRTAVAAGTEGAALAGLKKYEEAEPLLVDSYAVLSHDSGALSLFVTESARRLEALYSAWGKPEKAREYRALLD